RFKLRGWQTKAVLRAAFHDVVPPEILARRKMGFPVPVGRWLRSPLWPVVQEFVLGPRTLRRRLFDSAGLRRLAQEHRSRAKEHSDGLGRLVNLEIWEGVFREGEDAHDVMQAMP